MRTAILALVFSIGVGLMAMLFGGPGGTPVSAEVMDSSRVFDVPPAEAEKKLLGAPLPPSKDMDFMPEGAVEILPGKSNGNGTISWLMTIDDMGLGAISATIVPVKGKQSRIETDYALTEYSRKQYGALSRMFETELAKGAFRAASRTFAVRAVEGKYASGEEINTAARAFIAANPALLEAHQSIPREIRTNAFKEAEARYVR